MSKHIEEIKVGDIVYQKKIGWSGLPMEVLSFGKLTALCKGAQGWTLNGLWSLEHAARVKRLARRNLTHTRNSAMGG